MPYHLATPQYGKRKGTGTTPIPCSCLGWVMGLEPTTPGTTIRCSAIELHPPHWLFPHRESLTIIAPKSVGTPEGIRTPGLLLRRQLLYPTELLARILEQVTRIELASPAWKAGALTIVLHLHAPSEGNRQLEYINMESYTCQAPCRIFLVRKKTSCLHIPERSHFTATNRLSCRIFSVSCCTCI